MSSLALSHFPALFSLPRPQSFDAFDSFLFPSSSVSMIQHEPQPLHPQFKAFDLSSSAAWGDVAVPPPRPSTIYAGGHGRCEALAQAILNSDLSALEYLLQTTPIPAAPTAAVAVVPCSRPETCEESPEAPLSWAPTGTRVELSAHSQQTKRPKLSASRQVSEVEAFVRSTSASTDASNSPAPCVPAAPSTLARSKSVAASSSASSSPPKPRARAVSVGTSPRSAPVRAAAVRASVTVATVSEGDDEESGSNSGLDAQADSRAKRKYGRLKPQPQNFDTEDDYHAAFQAWRQHRDRNNRAVRKSRSLALKKDATEGPSAD